MLVRSLTFVALLLVVVPNAAAQVTLMGRVTDAVTGETLPAATVQIDGSFTGTITNAEGDYELAVDSLPVTLLVRYIGYETTRRAIEAGASPMQDIQLTSVAVQMDELVVSSEDPAPGIMQRVIERKQQWWPSLET
ncbi:MAG: carboxypeptidase-like regulatory domain-containing protein, partial [Bacteroidota bacterium]